MTAFSNFIEAMDDLALESYAQRVGSSKAYIQIHLKHARKTPRKELIDLLWHESEGRLSREDVLDHFFPPPFEQQAEAS